MGNDNLKQKAASGMVWTAIQKYSTMVITFIADMILARLLLPKDYGYIGMLAIFIGIAQNFIDGGFASAIIQKKKPSQQDYSTVFYFNIVMAFVIYGINYLCAPFIATFYRMPLLCDVLRVEGIVIIIYSFSVIQSSLIRKNLQFKKLSWIMISSSTIALAVTIIMAYHGYGVWSLVTQHILISLLPCILYWLTTDWYPSLVYSWKSFRELFGFGAYMFLTHIINTISNKLSGLLIGRLYTPSTMGYYSKAEQTENVASMNIASIMIQTTYPLYSSIQDDRQRLINVIKRITTTLSYVTTPILFILILIAQPLFLMFYSDRWLDSVPYFQILCIGGIAGCLQGVNIQAIAAVGKSKQMFVWTVVKRSIGIGLSVGGLFLFGIYGLLVGAVISQWFSYVVNASLVSKYVGYKLYRQLLDLTPPIVVACIGFFIAYIFSNFVIDNVYIIGIVRLGIFLLIYMGWSMIFKAEAYIYTLDIIRNKIKYKRS